MNKSSRNLRNSNMLLIYTSFLVFGVTRSAIAVDIDVDAPYCFQFTWLGPTKLPNHNCSSLVNTPCIPPFVDTTDGTLPNVTDIWHNDQTRVTMTCRLEQSDSCIKYVYKYNDAVVNISSFCGKMMQDKTTALTSGCYTQKVRGYVVEACACQSDAGRMPCNSSIRTQYSLNILIIVSSIFILVCNLLNIYNNN